jgi:hypothetical protein
LFGAELDRPVNAKRSEAKTSDTGETLETVARAAGMSEPAMASGAAEALQHPAGLVLGLGLGVTVGLVLAVINAIREGMAFEYEESLRRWNGAHYCSTDRIVFIRHMNDVQWASADKLRDLIQRTD